MPNGQKKGPPGSPPGQFTLPKGMDPNSLEDLKCGECENLLFTKLYRVKIMPAILSPNARPGLVFLEYTHCAKCGAELNPVGKIKEKEEDIKDEERLKIIH